MYCKCLNRAAVLSGWLAIALVVLMAGLPAQALDPVAPPGCDIGWEAPGVVPEREKAEYVSPLKQAAAAAQVVETSSIREPDMAWVDATLASMSLDEKAGQMIIQWYGSGSASQVDAYKVGGFIFSSWNTSGAESIVNAVNQLQSQSSIPLWFAADSECGVGARFGDALVLPMNMALAAAGDEVLAASAGWITGRESWALGVQIGFSPVVDVNTEPLNPIIGTRAYSDRPALVAKIARGYVEGAHRGGALTSFKHYPGHGPTESDSHTSLPVINMSESDFRRIHMEPYRLLIADGYSDLVMSAHIWCKAFDPGDPWPATLSKKLMTDILRTEYGFTGVTISDAFTMSGLGSVVSDETEAVTYAIQNGLDIILTPASTSVAFNAIKDAVQQGDLTVDQIDASVRRILIAKSRCWLPEARYRNVDDMWDTLKHPDHVQAALEIARASITRVREADSVLPLQSSQRVLCLTMQTGYVIFNSPARSYTNFTIPLADGVAELDVRDLGSSVESGEIDTIVAQAAGFDRVIVANYTWQPTPASSHITLVERLMESSTPLIYISFGSPYHGLSFPDIETFYCTYANAEVSQQAAAEAMLGDLEPTGKLPVAVFSEPAPSWIVH